MAHLRKMPDKILMKLDHISSPSICAGCVLKFTEKDIVDSNFSWLGIVVENDVLKLPSNPIYPSDFFGPVCGENINGKEIVEKDKPKVMKEIYLGERPNYGDWSKGSFSLWVSKLTYRRTFIQPRGFSLRIEEKGFDNSSREWKLVFTVEPTFAKADPSFSDDLLFALSLLREVTGKCDVYAADTSADEIAQTRTVSWEIFPPGQRDFRGELSNRLVRTDEKAKKIILERAKTIEALKPSHYIIGAGLASNYYGALFADDLVVFENLDYGNATYILYENWEHLSKLSRTKILSSHDKFDRVVHGTNWGGQISKIVSHELNRRKRCTQYHKNSFFD